MTLKVILLSIAIVAVAVVLLGVKVFFVKGGRFPSGHIHESEAMRRRGITCAHGHDNDHQSTH
jgi:hypothetical protein